MEKSSRSCYSLFSCNRYGARWHNWSYFVFPGCVPTANIQESRPESTQHQAQVDIWKGLQFQHRDQIARKLWTGAVIPDEFSTFRMSHRSDSPPQRCVCPKRPEIYHESLIKFKSVGAATVIILHRCRNSINWLMHSLIDSKCGNFASRVFSCPCVNHSGQHLLHTWSLGWKKCKTPHMEWWCCWRLLCCIQLI